MLKTFYDTNDNNLKVKNLIDKYKEELKDICRIDKQTSDAYGFVNTWWVFSEVSRALNYKIFMAETENVGYKRTKRGEKVMPNELYRSEITGSGKEKILLSDEDGKMETILDYMRKVEWK